jgi:excisionase family DNA binding protein
MDEPLLTVAEVASQLKVTEQSVRNWIDRGQLAAIRVGSRRVRIRRSDLDAFLGVGATDQAADVDALRGELRVSLDDARAAVGDDVKLASALRALAGAAKPLAARLERN